MKTPATLPLDKPTAKILGALDHCAASGPIPTCLAHTRRKSAHHGLTADGSQYTADETEFMLALDAWKRANRRPFPTCSEVLTVLRSLGYRKP